MQPRAVQGDMRIILRYVPLKHYPLFWLHRVHKATKLPGATKNRTTAGIGTVLSRRVDIKRMPLLALWELLQAKEYASSCRLDDWEFSIELRKLQPLSSSETWLRVLLDLQLVEHRIETTTRHSRCREFFVPSETNTKFTPESCFLLTEVGFAELSAALENYPKPTQGPLWDEELRELRVGEMVLKRFRVPAPNQEAILFAFEEENWVNRICDPLPPARDQCPKRRLHETIKSLNRNHQELIIRFRGDGTGEGVIWEYA